MNAIVFDIETLAACFCIVAHDTNGNKFEYVKSNDEMVEPRKVGIFLDAFTKYDKVAGYNSKGFDLRVLAWIAEQKNPVSVKEIADQASLLIADMNSKIGNQKTSRCWKANVTKWRNNHFDVLKCYTKEHSLKWWELARGWSVKESDVPWDKPYMSNHEVEETLKYCHHDVDATMKLFMEKECQGTIEARDWLLERCDKKLLPDCTIAELAEGYCYGNFEGDEEGTCESLISWYDYDIPTNVLDMFMAIARGDVNGFCWNGRLQKVIVVDSEEYKTLLKSSKGEYFDSDWAFYGKGGAHYAKAGRNKDVHIFDVASLYPSIIQHWLPLKCEKAQKKYVDSKLERIRIKRLKGTPQYSKSVDLALKLNLNSLSGKFRMKGAQAYAPNHGLAMCIIGQLLITEATWFAMNKNPENWNRVIEINTDSFAVVGDDMIARSQDYMQSMPHKFEFEEEVFHDSYWKDVNHYVVYKADGSIQESHGDFEMDSEPIIMKSLYNIANKDVEEPFLVDSTDYRDFLVKYAKSGSAKNASIGGEKMDKKYYYFMWVTADCTERQAIKFNADEQDRRMGVTAFDPVELEKYFQYVDKEQYMDDFRKTLKTWGLTKLATPLVKVKKINPFFECEGGLF